MCLRFAGNERRQWERQRAIGMILNERGKECKGDSTYDVRTEGGGEGVKKAPNLSQNSIYFADQEGGGGKNPRIMWMSFMEAPSIIPCITSAQTQYANRGLEGKSSNWTWT